MNNNNIINNEAEAIDNELDSIFDITPLRIKHNVERHISKLQDSQLGRECEAASDELAHKARRAMRASPRSAWASVKKPFTTK